MVRHCAEQCVCMCVSQSGLCIFSFFEEDVVLRHCAESSFSFASVCVCVLHRVAFKDCFAAFEGIPRVEFKSCSDRDMCAERVGRMDGVRPVLRAAMLAAEYAMTK